MQFVLLLIDRCISKFLVIIDRSSNLAFSEEEGSFTSCSWLTDKSCNISVFIIRYMTLFICLWFVSKNLSIQSRSEKQTGIDREPKKYIALTIWKAKKRGNIPMFDVTNLSWYRICNLWCFEERELDAYSELYSNSLENEKLEAQFHIQVLVLK